MSELSLVIRQINQFWLLRVIDSDILFIAINFPWLIIYAFSAEFYHSNSTWIGDMTSLHFDPLKSRKVIRWKTNIAPLRFRFLFYGFRMYLIHVWTRFLFVWLKDQCEQLHLLLPEFLSDAFGNEIACHLREKAETTLLIFGRLCHMMIFLLVRRTSKSIFCLTKRQISNLPFVRKWFQHISAHSYSGMINRQFVDKWIFRTLFLEFTPISRDWTMSVINRIFSILVISYGYLASNMKLSRFVLGSFMTSVNTSLHFHPSDEDLIIYIPNQNSLFYFTLVPYVDDFILKSSQQYHVFIRGWFINSTFMSIGCDQWRLAIIDSLRIISLQNWLDFTN